MVWWQQYGENGGGAEVTWSGKTDLLGDARAAINWLLGKLAGQTATWKIDTGNSEGRLVIIKESNENANICASSNKDKK